MTTVTSPAGEIPLINVDAADVPEIHQVEGPSSGSAPTTRVEAIIGQRNEDAQAPETGNNQAVKRDTTQEADTRPRSFSLRHVRNSKEVLRERSIKHAHAMSDGIPSPREGRNFTVSNVGTGGMIYLRPSTLRPQMMAQNSSFVSPPLTPPRSATLEPENEGELSADQRHSVWSTSQISEKLARPPLQRSASNESNNNETTYSDQPRAHSASTLEEHERSTTQTPDGTLRIVIDRSPLRKATAAALLTHPTLDVQIPHYRLGTPRFSSQGTPILRSSVYTRTSAVPSEAGKLANPNKQGAFSSGSATLGPWQPSHPFLRPNGVNSFQKLETTGSASGPQLETTGHLKQSIGPALFDDLAVRRDNPSVVRYSQRTGDIIAATPARIVAQISSELFMDYDLVSDFFLTFRSYLSTNDLLSLLMARLRWAINRLEDDGRIIRIRTFAALRHWILNYFMDDFVEDLPLRVEFCDQINSMYGEVRQRIGGGSSDLKILQDLKRCWNGRCSLYWNSADFVIDSHQEADIVPGGVVIKDPSSSAFDHDKLKKSHMIPRVGLKPNRRRLTESWLEEPPKSRRTQSRRENGVASRTEGPSSISSEKSLQPSSCSLPTKALGRSTNSPDHQAKGLHPVPSSARRQVSPSTSHPTSAHTHKTSAQSHKRSGSQSDSYRDLASTSVPQKKALLILPDGGSLIRGQLFPPASPYIDVLPPTTPGQRTTFDILEKDPRLTTHTPTKSDGSASPISKTFIGSIRRALSSRQPNNTASRSQRDLHSRISSQGKTSTLPINVARSHDALRSKPVAPAPRNHLRIDLLCAAISHSYQLFQSNADDQQALFNEENHVGLGLAPPDTSRPTDQRLGSQASAQSGSIVIVDDTGLDIPVMSGALPSMVSNHHDSYISGGLNSNSRAIMSMSHSAYLSRPTTVSVSQRSSGIFARRRSNSLDSGMDTVEQRISSAVLPDRRLWPNSSMTRSSTLGPNKKSRSTATTLRKYASYQSNSTRQPNTGSFFATIPTVSDITSADSGATKAAPHMLRRRPGGDLRKVENVHDLSSNVRPLSQDSAATDSDSDGGSLVIMANRTNESKDQAPQPPAKGRVSLIHTHSSQHLRPSFEAAVAGFSDIPDDDDGGLEATLLKLEGKYEKLSPALSSENPSPNPETAAQNQWGNIMIADDKITHRQHRVQEDIAADFGTPGTQFTYPTASPRSDMQDKSRHRHSSIYGLPTESIANSEDSDLSVPLLERGLADESMKKPSQILQSTPMIIIPEPLFSHKNDSGRQASENSHPSIEFVEETDSMKRIPHGATIPMVERPQTADSFLLDADENLSDLSSELSMDIIDYSEVVPRNTSPLFAAPGTALSGLEIPTHPLANPPTPNSGLHRIDTNQSVNPMMFQSMPLTPDLSPTQGQQQKSFKTAAFPQVTIGMPTPAKSPVKLSASSGHIPFVLAYDSQLLAEQMTLVEKAALSEIEWRDLIDMQWDNEATKILNWVEMLSSGHHKGIDLVITRFNLMVKWTLSEIVLTQDIHERARTIMKFIHVAAHARRLHNFATMLQLTIALTSVDCTSLTKTWELVNPPERSLLKNMEALSQPLRNFHDLRVEMETANLSEGCIPFVGLYVHDLTYNAQKPAQMLNTRNGEPLINFERCRTAATIVKGLLRLIDASSKYQFPGVEGVIERCLWTAALSDDKIRALSQSLE